MKAVSLLAVLLLLLLAISSAKGAFNCSSTSTCQAMIGYKPINSTTIRDIQTLFEVPHIRSLLGANSLPLSTRSTQSITAGSTFRVPFNCSCNNGNGNSDRRPVYKVKKDDTLSAIATGIFSGFMTFQEIAAVNNIADANVISVGQELWVPLPCSCDVVDGSRVVHYAHKVASESTVAQIANEFGTTEQILLTLNGISDPKSLQADQILDVPLSACSSVISNTSSDSGLLVPVGSYALTAHDCVQCGCNSSGSQLHCSPSGASNRTCSSMQCEGSTLYLGNATTSDCQNTTCSYAGYTGNTIVTTLVNQSTCPTNVAPGSSPNSSSSRLGLQGLSWRWLFISLNVGFLCFASTLSFIVQ
ncbi:lysM domain-containing GPI-anchored protein 2-like [Tasmannia lanceolata]|uniref:lysM domain-containing GPI-anchored protein 2-like n=1 Tax=Tasmannia lanceolata TaxID=3420 RepID=UPI0040640DA2